MKKILSAIVLALFFVGTLGVSFAASKDIPSPNIKQKVFVYWPKYTRGKRPPQPPIGPTCSTTGNDQEPTYLVGGWFMPDTGEGYVINVSTAPSNLKSIHLL